MFGIFLETNKHQNFHESPWKSADTFPAFCASNQLLSIKDQSLINHRSITNKSPVNHTCLDELTCLKLIKESYHGFQGCRDPAVWEPVNAGFYPRVVSASVHYPSPDVFSTLLVPFRSFLDLWIRSDPGIQSGHMILCLNHQF